VTNTQLVFGTVKVWLRVLTTAFNEDAATSCFLSQPRSANAVDKAFCWNEEQYVNVDQATDSDSDSDFGDDDGYSSSDSNDGDEAGDQHKNAPDSRV